MDALKVQFSVFIFRYFPVMLANAVSDRSKYINRIVVATLIHIHLLKNKENLEFVHKNYLNWIQ